MFDLTLNELAPGQTDNIHGPILLRMATSHRTEGHAMPTKPTERNGRFSQLSENSKSIIVFSIAVILIGLAARLVS